MEKKVTVEVKEKVDSLDASNVEPPEASWDNAHNIKLALGKNNYQILLDTGSTRVRWAYGDIFVHVMSDEELSHY